MANEPLKTAVVTDIGKAKLDAAYQAGEKVIISQMALGNSNLAYVVPDPAFTELVNEFGRQDINEGNTTDSWINALVYVDSQQFAGESILEFGLYDTDGDLIVYSSYTPSVVPAVGQDYIQLEIECSVDLYNASAVTIEVTPIYPQATELERGIAKVATEADIAAGIDDEKIVTPKKLATIAQFGPYRSDKVYQCGEVCYTKDANGKVTYWEWYSNVESLAGKDPLNTANRRIGWTDVTKPFYWKLYMPKVAGETMYWDTDAIPENMVVGIGQQLPKAVYHSLATAKPEWIDATDNTLINIPDRQGRFVRAANGTTWQAGEMHEDAIRNITGWFNSTINSSYLNTGGAFTSEPKSSALSWLGTT
ncbi:phage tail protein, partial [Vibrio cholerae]